MLHTACTGTAHRPQERKAPRLTPAVAPCSESAASKYTHRNASFQPTRMLNALHRAGRRLSGWQQRLLQATTTRANAPTRIGRGVQSSSPPRQLAPTSHTCAWLPAADHPRVALIMSDSCRPACGQHSHKQGCATTHMQKRNKTESSLQYLQHPRSWLAYGSATSEKNS